MVRVCSCCTSETTRDGAIIPQEPLEGANRLDALDLAKQIVDISSEKQASDIVMLDLRNVSLLADYFVICSANSERQIAAIVDEMIEGLRRAEHRHPLRREGNASSGWVLVDYGDVIVHVFAPVERDYYRLEELWAGAVPVIRLQ
jgi:ribosome-associated protein